MAIKVETRFPDVSEPEKSALKQARIFLGEGCVASASRI